MKQALTIKSCLLLILVLNLGACGLLPGDFFKRREVSGIDVMPVAVNLLPFGQSEEKARKVEAINDIIRANLKRSGRFRPLQFDSPAVEISTSEDVDYEYWTSQGIRYLISGRLQTNAKHNRPKAEYWIIDIAQRKRLQVQSRLFNHADVRHIAHQISDDIFESVLGLPGPFSTKLSYVTAEQKENKIQYVLWLADADAHNKEIIFSSAEPIMSPSWSPDASMIAYASLQAGGRQQIYIHYRNEAKSRLVKIDNPGLIGAPAWSPDGEKIAFTIIQQGNADIYVLDIETEEVSRVTSHAAIDTEAVWLRDGETLVFTSDRSGRPQLYEIPVYGGEARLITHSGRENAQAAVSPQGKHIAMLQSHEGRYKIALLNRDTGNIKILTEGELDESPSFSPNGSMIVYTTSDGVKSKLAVVSVDGKAQQNLATFTDVREPSWSPILD